jgi:hypothetical protein
MASLTEPETIFSVKLHFINTMDRRNWKRIEFKQQCRDAGLMNNSAETQDL